MKRTARCLLLGFLIASPLLAGPPPTGAGAVREALLVIRTEAPAPQPGERVYTWDEDALRETFGAGWTVTEDGFAYQWGKMSYRVVLAGGEAARVVSLDGTLTWRFRPLLDGRAPAFLLGPEGSVCRFDLGKEEEKPFCRNLYERRFRRLVGRMREEGSPESRLPVSLIVAVRHRGDGPGTLYDLYPEGSAYPHEGADGRTPRSYYSFRPSADGKSATVEFTARIQTEQSRFEPIEVSFLPQTDRPAFWVRGGDEFGFLAPEAEGFRSVKTYSFYDKGKWHRPIEVPADARTWILEGDVWSYDESEGALMGWSDLGVTAIPMDGVREHLFLASRRQQSSTPPFGDFILEGLLLNYDEEGYRTIRWRRSEKEAAGEKKGDVPRIPIEVTADHQGEWHLAPPGKGPLSKRVLIRKEGTILKILWVASGDTLGEAVLPTDGNDAVHRNMPMKGLPRKAVILAENRGWFVFVVPGRKSRLLFIEGETGASREVALPERIRALSQWDIGVRWRLEELFPLDDPDLWKELRLE